MATEGPAAGALEAIILAAGAGSRFGGAKLTAPWRGGLLIEGALAAAFAAPVRRVTLVTGADRHVETAGRAFAGARGQSGRLRIVHAADHAQGMAASMRAGISSLAADSSGAFVFLGDMPRVPAAVLPALARALAAGAKAAAPAFAGQRGHPVLFAKALFPQLRALTGDAGAREVLAAIGDGFALVDAHDDGVLYDVDAPSDLI